MSSYYLIWLTLVAHVWIITFWSTLITLIVGISLLTILSILLIAFAIIRGIIIIKYQILNSGMLHSAGVLLRGGLLPCGILLVLYLNFNFAPSRPILDSALANFGSRLLFNNLHSFLAVIATDIIISFAIMLAGTLFAFFIGCSLCHIETVVNVFAIVWSTFSVSRITCEL